MFFAARQHNIVDENIVDTTLVQRIQWSFESEGKVMCEKGYKNPRDQDDAAKTSS